MYQRSIETKTWLAALGCSPAFHLEKDRKLTEEKLAVSLSATDPDLKAFRARGGKLILYHGWSDAALPPVNTINYFQSVVAKLGRRQAKIFLRLYWVGDSW